MSSKMKNLIYILLRKSQKFTGTDNVYIAAQGSYLTIGNIISTLASFLLAMAFARLLPKETYGQYRYILSIMTVVGICALPGMETAIIQSVARKLEGSFKKILKTRLRWGLLGSFTSLVIAVYFLIEKNLPIAISLLIAALFFPVMQSAGSYLSYLTGKKLFGIQVKYNTLTQIIATISIIITLFLTKNLIILVLIYFLSNTVLRSYFLLRTIKKNPPNKRHSPKAISFGKHLTVMNIITTIAGQLDKILLFNFLGAAQVAIYSFAELPVRQINSFLRNIRLLALPKLSVRTRKEIKKTLLKKVAKATLLILPIIAVYIFIDPYIYKIFFPQYMNSVFYSQLLAFTLIAFPATIVAISFEARVMKKELYQLSIISPVIRIVSLIILTPLLGLLGVIIAELLTRAFNIFLALFLFRKI
jgi:O-antigen/teichoic acid export membrane protein